MNYNMDSLKASYAAIEIPEELEFMVRTAMRKASNNEPLHEKAALSSPVLKQRLTAGRFAHRVKIALGVAAALLAGFIGLANSTPALSYAMEQLPVIGPLAQIVTIREFNDTTGTMSASVSVPGVKGSAQANKAIAAYTDKIIAQYKKDVDSFGGAAREDVNLTYTKVTDNDALFALRFDTTITAGDSAQIVKIYNVDKRSGALMTLGNLFKDDADFGKALHASIVSQMHYQMEHDASKAYFTDAGAITAENLSTSAEDVSFYVNRAGELVLVFNEGAAAPMYMGVVSFTIPRNITAPLSNGVYLK